MTDDTIVALSSAHGRAALAVIRLSGKDSLNLIETVFSSYSELKDRKAVYGVIDTGSIRDDVIVVYYKAPHSYTGEDIVEIFSHGSPVIAESIIKSLIKKGARQATRGEYTRRAFEKGKLTLSESEGIIDLIDAQSESAVRAAYNLAEGKLSERTAEIKKKTVDLIAELNVALDYPEEDIETETLSESAVKCKEILNEAILLSDTYERGRKIKDGVLVVIAGKPNAGKSTLLNALVGYERAIVTEEEGTTRDTVEATYIYKGVLFNVTDTAGIRENYTSEAERQGIERSLNAVQAADVIIALDDTVMTDPNKTVRVSTKSDLKTPREGTLAVSGKTGSGIDELKEVIFEKTGVNVAEEILLTNLRQFEAVDRCIKALERALKSFEAEADVELITVDLLEAVSAIGSIDGATATKEVVDDIFSRFCVGK